MENPSKRRRLSEGSEHAGTNGSSRTSLSHLIAGASSADHDGKYESAQYISLTPDSASAPGNRFPSTTIGIQNQELLLRASAPTPATYGHLYNRDLLPSAVGAVKTVVQSVVDVIIDNGNSAIAAITLPGIPAGPTVVTVPSLGVITIPESLYSDPTPTQWVGTTTTSILTSQTPITSVSQSSLSIDASMSSSQIVLSSPPSTPLPSGSAMSFPSTSTFSESLFPPSSKSRYTFSTILGSSRSTIAPSASLTPTGNFSTSTFTSTQSDSTFIGTTTFQFGSITSNSTRHVTSSTSQTTSFAPPPFTTRTFETSSTVGSSRSSQSSVVATSTSHSETTALSSLSSSSSSSSSASPAFSASGSTAGISATGGGSIGPGSTNAGTTSATPSSTAPPVTGSHSSISPQTSAVVGGVVGGLAGLTILLVILLFILKWRRKKMQNRQLAGRNGDTELAETNLPSPDESMVERSSPNPLAAQGLAPFLRRLRPHSSQTNATTETAPSERGFQNFGGRKIESVLRSGGDGYGDPGPSNPGNLSATSFYRDSQGTYGGPGSLPSSMYVGPGSPPLSPNLSGGVADEFSVPSEPLGPSELPSHFPDKEVAVMRPGPARTPVTSQGLFATTSQTTPPLTPSPIPPAIRDAVGRSHPSFDGSRSSRFAENLE